MKSIEKDVQRAIEAGQTVIKTCASKTVNTGRSISMNMTDKHDQHPAQQLNESHRNQGDQSRFLKPLKVPAIGGDKRTFEGFGALFRILVDESPEPANLTMARLWQRLTGNALEAIRGLGVTTPEYEGAKEILKSKYRGACRQSEIMIFTLWRSSHTLCESRSSSYRRRVKMESYEMELFIV